MHHQYCMEQNHGDESEELDLCKSKEDEVLSGTTRKDSARNIEIRVDENVKCMKERVQKITLRCYRKVKRMWEERLPKSMEKGRVEGKRLRGQQRTRWKDEVTRNVER